MPLYIVDMTGKQSSKGAAQATAYEGTCQGRTTHAHTLPGFAFAREQSCCTAKADDKVAQGSYLQPGGFTQQAHSRQQSHCKVKGGDRGTGG